MAHITRALPRIRPWRAPAEVRRPDVPAGIEAARRKWEARLLAGGMSRSETRRLATAEEVRRRVKESRVRRFLDLRRELGEAEATWRRNFRPHAVALTERERPSLVIGMMIFGDQRLVYFPEETDPASFRDQVLRALPEDVPLFGRPIGFIVNYTPDRAVEFDLHGSEAKSYSGAFRPGRASFKFSDGWFDARAGQPDDPGDARARRPLHVRPATWPKQLQDIYRRERSNRCEATTSETKATS